MAGRGYFKAVVILVLLFAASYLLGGRVPYLLFFIGLGLLLADWLWSETGKNASVRIWTESPDSMAGTRVRVFTEIVNNSPWPIPWIQIWIEMPGTFGLPGNLCCYTFSLEAYERKVASEEMECKIRGSFDWGRGIIKGGGFLNVFTCSGSFGQPVRMEVLPKFLHPGSFGIRGWREEAGEIQSVRRYDTGDSLSRIHWKISARNQHLLVKRQQQPERLNTVIWLDNGRERHFVDGCEGSFEQAVSLAASLAAASMAAGQGTGLVLCDSKSTVVRQQLQPVSFGCNRTDFISLLKQLVHVTVQEGSVQGQAFGKVVSSLSQAHLVLISGELDNATVEMLLRERARGRHITIFLFRLETFGREGINKTSRDKLILRLKSSGIQVTTLDKDSNLRLILGRPLYGAG